MRYHIDGSATDGAVQIHEPDLYRADRRAATVETLEDIDRDAYRELGYQVVENVFTEAEIEAARAGLRHLVDGGVPEYDGLYFERFAEGRVDELQGDERIDAVRKLAYYVEFEPRLKALSHHPRILETVRTLLGGHEPWMFQDMGMLKPPGGREKPWHQDKAYFDFPLDTPVVGVWVCLDEVDEENGCMFLLEGAHKLGPVVHFNRRDWQICDSEVRDKRSEWPVVSVPLKPGGCLFFDGLLPHGTPMNRTDKRRRALQFHYAPATTQKTSADERLAHFGSEGKNVTC